MSDEQVETPDATESDATTQGESTPSTESQQGDSRAQMLAAYNRLAGIETKEDKPAGEPEPKRVTDDVKGGKEAPKMTAKPDQPKADDAIDPAKLEKAKSALKRWQYPDHLISSMKPEELLERGEKAAAAQAEQDRFGNEKQQLQRMLRELEAERQNAAAVSTMKQPEKQPTQPQAGLEPDPVTKLSEVLSDPLYEELSGPLKAALESVQKSAVEMAGRELSQMLEKSKAELDTLYLQLDAMHIDAAKRELLTQYPKLKDPTVFQGVRKRVYELANLSGYRDETGSPDWGRLVTDAARLEGLDQETKQEQQDRLIERHRQQLEGQTTDEHERKSPSASLDPRAAMRKAIKHLSSGKSVDEVRRLVTSATAE